MTVPVISIIIPLYNVRPYLEQCVRSVMAQSYREWECILVDDGSTDGSDDMCNMLAHEDDRIVVIHQHNQGVSVARNVGLSKAVGKYVVFIDADDWVDETYLSDMLESSDDSTGLIVSGIITENKGRADTICPSKKISMRITSEIQSSEWVEFISLLYAPYVKLYKRSVICDYCLKFPESKSLGEDMIFNLDYIGFITEVLFIPRANYHYRIIGDSSLSSIYRHDKFEIEYDLWKRRKIFFDEKGLWNKELKEYMDAHLWGIVYNGVFNVKRPTMKYLRGILGIPEISSLKFSSFKASSRIKKAIIDRDVLFFYLLRRIKG